MKNLKVLLIGLLAKQLNKSDDEVAALIFKADEQDESKLTEEIKDGALDDLLKLDKTRVKDLKAKAGDTTEAFNNGFKKAQKETLETFEKDVREQYTYEGEEKGAELIAAVVSAAVTKAGGAELTEDKVKTTEVYRTLEKQLKTREKELVTEKETAISELQAEHQLIQSTGKVNEAAVKELAALKPVYSKNATIADTQQKDFLASLHGNGTTFKTEADGTILLMDGDKRKEDEHGNPIEFGAFIKEKAATRFEFEVQGKKGQAGNEEGGSGGAGGAGTKWAGTVPATRDEMNSFIFEASSTEERGQMVTAWNEANPEDAIE